MVMSMGYGAIPLRVVLVLVMLVVAVRMFVVQGLVAVVVLVAFADMQPYSESHQCAGDPERNVWGLA